jgi:hypothetical protein
MSSKNNVNPDHYKTGGRLRQGEAIVHEEEKKEFTQSRADAKKQNYIPGAPPVQTEQSEPEQDEESQHAGKS